MSSLSSPLNITSLRRDVKAERGGGERKKEKEEVGKKGKRRGDWGEKEGNASYNNPFCSPLRKLVQQTKHFPNDDFSVRIIFKTNTGALS